MPPRPPARKSKTLRAKRVQRQRVLHKKLFRGLHAQAHLFTALREPIPLRPDELEEKTKALEKWLAAQPLPPRAREQLGNVLHQIRDRAHKLSRIKEALHTREIVPAELLRRIFVQRARQLDRAHPPSLEKSRLPHYVRAAVDWIGIHFYVPATYAPFLAQHFQFLEKGIGGVSFTVPSFQFAEPQKTTIVIKDAGVSITLTGQASRRVESHEKWHDYEQLRNTMRSTLDQLPQKRLQKIRYTTVHHLLDGWFRNELSAVLAQGHPDYEFPRRIHAYFSEVQRKIKGGMLSPAEIEKIHGFETYCQHVRELAETLAHGQHLTLRNTSRTEIEKDTLLQARAKEFSHLLAAGIVAMTPTTHLVKRLERTREFIPHIGPLPPIRPRATAIPDPLIELRRHYREFVPPFMTRKEIAQTLRDLRKDSHR